MTPCANPKSKIQNPKSHPRGSAAVALLVVMLVVSLLIIGVVLGGARDQDLSEKRLDTIRAFYAAEAGMNMAIRELMENTDADGDGTIGSISNDGNSSNDPAMGVARVAVSLASASGTTTLSSNGRSGDARRALQATLE